MNDLTQAIEEARHGRTQKVKCPAHDDGEASLNVSPGRNQPVVLHCHAGCETPDILVAAHLGWEAITNPPEQQAETIWTPAGNASHVYSYTDEAGEELFQVLRVPKGGSKTFRQRHMIDGRWVWNINDVRRVLYRLPEVKRAIEQGHMVYLVEGEKDVETLRMMGLTATTMPMGAGKWQPEYSDMLRGAQVTIVTDADEPGRRHARTVQQALSEVDVAATVVEPKAGAKDVTEHLGQGGTIASLVEIRTAGQPQGRPANALNLDEMADLTFPPDDFVIDHSLAREERMILTGHEGVGKAEMLRQFAVMTCAGIHPFTCLPMTPRRVLYVDAQDSKRQQNEVYARLRRLCRLHHLSYDPNGLMILSEYEDPPDLLTLAGADWLYERIMAFRPDLVCMGPIQNLVGRDVKDDDVVRKFKHAVDRSREICGSAYVMEHHAPYKSGLDKDRPVRPYGSSLFLKWPEFGYGLRPTEQEGVFDFHPNRLPRVRARRWPDRVRWGVLGSHEWPWVECEPAHAPLRAVPSWAGPA